MSPKRSHVPLAVALAAVCMVATALPAHAQPPASPCDGRVDTFLFQTSVVASRTDGSREDTALHEMRRDRLLARARALAEAWQSAAQPTTRRDSVLNGVLIGAGIGALLGLIPDHYDDCEECHDSLYGSIAVGAGVGLLIDLLRSDTRTVSPSRSDGGLRLGVAGGRRSVGVRGIVRWR
jgi:ElaB/YqjD/DUF883 family membrane-anchored ribosome-binding protein